MYLGLQTRRLRADLTFSSDGNEFSGEGHGMSVGQQVSVLRAFKVRGAESRKEAYARNVAVDAQTAGLRLLAE